MIQNPTIKTHTQQRDDLVQQCSSLNRRKAELTGIINELNETVAGRRQDIAELDAVKKRILETEIPAINDLIAKVKFSAKTSI